MQRITRSNLDNVVALLNRITNAEPEPYTNGKYNPGTYYIAGAYGGWALHQITASGGERDVLSSGYVSMRALYDMMHAYRNGLWDAKSLYTTAEV